MSSPPAAPHLARTQLIGALLEGWTLTAVAGIAVAVTALAVVLVGGVSEETIRSGLRVTARASFVLFFAAFTASVAHRLWPASPVTRWQRRNRRYLGVAFAASHLVHAAMIAAFATLVPEAFHEHTTRTSPIPASITYLVILAMTVTSFDRTAAWLGRRGWRVLHAVGGFVIWAAFLMSFGSRALGMPGYWLPTIFVIGAMALKVIAWLRGRR